MITVQNQPQKRCVVLVSYKTGLTHLKRTLTTVLQVRFFHAIRMSPKRKSFAR